MSYRYGRYIAAFFIILLLALPGVAEQDKKKRKAASLDGTTGLFKTWDAETLRRGEINLSLGFSHYNRDPGELVIKTIPFSFAVGLMDRLEIFGGLDLQKRVTASSIRTYRVLPGQLPRPAQTLNGATYFTNEAPLMDVPRGQGLGDPRFGAKFSILSERLGNKFSLAGVTFIDLPISNDIAYLNRGLTTGQVQGGFGGLISKRAGNMAQLHGNILVNLVGSPTVDLNRLAKLQNELIVRGGAAFPAYGRVQLITEVDGKVYYGSRENRTVNPRSPLDVNVGVRAFLNDNWSASLGYRASLNHVKEDLGAKIYPAGTNGWIGQLAFGTRHNDPPSVTCAIANASIKQDETTTIRANAGDPDGDLLSYSWTSTGGKISGTADTATFDATGVAPGRYTVTSTVSDRKHQASCSADVTVIKKNLAPTVSCSPASSTITQGETATIRASASDPNNDSLTYSWTVNGEKVAADAAAFNFGSVGRQPGNYRIGVTVSDGELTATCSSTVTVKELIKPNQPPRIECLTTTLDVMSGGSVDLKARATDPDGDRLSYSWSSTGGSVNGSGDNAVFNAAGVKAGIYTVTAAVDDGRGGKASCTMTVNVSEKMGLAMEKGGWFAPGSHRVDNVAKALLDDLAARMKNEPRLYANVIGYTDGSRRETSLKGLGGKRAKAVVDYLTKKGVDASRLTATDGGSKNPVGDDKTAAGRQKNRRAEIELTFK